LNEVKESNIILKLLQPLTTSTEGQKGRQGDLKELEALFGDKI